MASILIVDDDLRIQELLMRWLRAEGHTLRFAEDSNAAVESIAKEHPTVIVCDVHMPGANGLWLADRVRAIAPTTAIVIATGDQDVPPVESLRKGVVAYMVKPFQRDAFLNAVSKGVEWSRSAQLEARRIRSAQRQLPAPQER